MLQHVCIALAILAVSAPILAFARGEGDARAIAGASNAFGCRLYAQLDQQPGNLLISPHSIHAALSMTLLGARGQTADQMAATLDLFHHVLSGAVDHLESADPGMALDYKILLSGTPTMPGLSPPAAKEKKAPYDLISVNALWGQKGYAFLPTYLADAKDTFGGSLHEVDFADAPVACKTINTWVEDQTHDKIKELVTPQAVGRDTRLVLTNAVYFKSAWANPFSKAATRDDPFTLASGQKVQVPTMHQTNYFAYTQGGDCSAIGLPYERGDLSLWILLPASGKDLAELEKTLTPGRLDSLIKEARSRRINLAMPRFKFTAQYDLVPPLKALGMTDAFNAERADFSGIDGAKDLVISAVIHKTFIDVDEAGTEAAAATAVGMSRMSMMPQPPLEVKIDRPFGFLIRHRATGTILFLGRVTDPR